MAVSALAADDEVVRTESFAALEALQIAVGPKFGDSRGSAAAFCRDGRTLSFMLNVLRDSIEEPLQKLSLLFLCFFYHSFRIFLRPAHEAYSVVMKYMLRQPALDVKDCKDIWNLLRSIDTSSGIKATLYLGWRLFRTGSGRDKTITSLEGGGFTRTLC